MKTVCLFVKSRRLGEAKTRLARKARGGVSRLLMTYLML